jgi:hypothetical protein
VDVQLTAPTLARKCIASLHGVRSPLRPRRRQDRRHPAVLHTPRLHRRAHDQSCLDLRRGRQRPHLDRSRWPGSATRRPRSPVGRCWHPAKGQSPARARPTVACRGYVIPNRVFCASPRSAVRSHSDVVELAPVGRDCSVTGAAVECRPSDRARSCAGSELVARLLAPLLQGDVDRGSPVPETEQGPSRTRGKGRGSRRRGGPLLPGLRRS